MPKSKMRKIGRDAITGRWLSVEMAKKRRRTAVVERIRYRRRKTRREKVK